MDLSIKKIKELSKNPEDVNASLGKRILRQLSYYTTKIFLSTSLMPNDITILSFAFGLIGISLFSFGIFEYYLAGFFIHFFGRVLDYTDGNVARIKKQASLKGKFLDLIFGIILNAAFYLSVGYGAYSITNDNIFLIIAGTTAVFSCIVNYSFLLNKFIKIENNLGQKNIALVSKLKKSGFSFFISLFNHITAEENIILVVAAFLNIIPLFVVFYFFFNFLRIFVFLYLMSKF